MLIGISGKIGSGKDTFADLLLKYKPNLEKKAFAHKVKLITSTMSGATLDMCYSQEGKNVFLPDWNMTVGEFQQRLGTEAIRNNLHPEAWILALFSDFHPLADWVITDVRFPNELEAIKKRNGLILRIEGDPAKVRANSKRDLNHPSETSLDEYTDWDILIINTGTLALLEAQAKALLEYMDRN